MSDTHPLRKERLKQFELLAIVLREVRRRNWGGASNVLRVLLLIERPGVYIDHDDTVGHLGQLYGFRYALSRRHPDKQLSGKRLQVPSAEGIPDGHS